MADIERTSRPPKPVRTPLKLNPSTGRTVSIGSSGIDVGRGFRLLEQSCARNLVKKDFYNQRFHERGGLKRKRLRRERWRRRFLEGFKATVGRVKQLKNQGW
jgi:small subunit ribosomal protein MRP21